MNTIKEANEDKSDSLSVSSGILTEVSCSSNDENEEYDDQIADLSEFHESKKSQHDNDLSDLTFGRQSS